MTITDHNQELCHKKKEGRSRAGDVDRFNDEQLNCYIFTFYLIKVQQHCQLETVGDNSPSDNYNAIFPPLLDLNLLHLTWCHGPVSPLPPPTPIIYMTISQQGPAKPSLQTVTPVDDAAPGYWIHPPPMYFTSFSNYTQADSPERSLPSFQADILYIFYLILGIRLGSTILIFHILKMYAFSQEIEMFNIKII